MKRFLVPAVKCLLSIAILTYLFNKAINEDQFLKLFSAKKNWLWLATGFVSCLMAHLFGFVRWRIMVRAIDLPFSFRDAMRIGFMGVFFNLIAFGVVGGDVLRGFYITREFQNRKAEAIASVVADRMSGMLTTFLVASLAFQFLDFDDLRIHHPQKWAAIRLVCHVVTVATVIGISALLAMFFTRRLGQKSWMRSLLNVPTLGKFLRNVFGVVSVYRNRPGAILGAFGCSLMVNASFAFSIFAIAVGLFDDAPGFASHFIISPITMVSNAIPLPGGLGGMEVALHLMYQAFDCEHGVVVAFTYRFCLLSVSAIGAVVWFLNRSSVKDLMNQEV